MSAYLPPPARLRLPLLLLAGLALYLLSGLRVLPATHFGLEFRLGRMARVHDAPGLYWTLPAPFGRLEQLDRRLQLATVQDRECLTADRRNLVVTATLVWRIESPERYWQTLGAEPHSAGQRIAEVLASAVGTELGQRSFETLLSAESTEPGQSSGLTALSEAILTRARELDETLGISSREVRLPRLTFAETNRQAVLRRMEAERQAIAAGIRARGQSQAAERRSQAEQRRAELLAEAETKAAAQAAEAEAEAARLLREMTADSPEWYQFLRELEFYEQVLGKDTTLYLTDQEPFLRMLYQGPPQFPVPPADKPVGPPAELGHLSTPQRPAPTSTEGRQ